MLRDVLSCAWEAALSVLLAGAPALTCLDLRHEVTEDKDRLTELGVLAHLTASTRPQLQLRVSAADALLLTDETDPHPWMTFATRMLACKQLVLVERNAAGAGSVPPQRRAKLRQALPLARFEPYREETVFFEVRSLVAACFRDRLILITALCQ
jgi:hypothetical protein